MKGRNNEWGFVEYGSYESFQKEVEGGRRTKLAV
jgi:hypothetical protein